jgi:hypothetical protein
MLYTQPEGDMEPFLQVLDLVIQRFCAEAKHHFEKMKTHMKLHSLVHLCNFY